MKGTLTAREVSRRNLQMAGLDAKEGIFDVNDPEGPKVGAYFVPPMGLKIDDDMAAPVHGIFVEWDRNLIWLFANHGIYAISTTYLGEPVIGLPG